MVDTKASTDIGRPNAGILLYASALVHNKPGDLSVREYLRLLKQHEAKGRRDDALSSTYHHLDRSSWWRSEYERQKEATAIATHEADDLRLEIASLKAKLDSASRTKKRKKVDEDIVPVPRSPKRSKQNDSSVKRTPGDDEAIAAFDFSAVGEVGNILMRSFYQVNAILKSNHKTEPSILAHQCVRASSAIPQVLRQARHDSNSNTDCTTGGLKPVLTACSRAILSLVMGFNRLSHVTDGAQYQGQVIYAYVQMYAKLVSELTETSKTEVAKAIREESPAKADKKSLTVNAKGKQPVRAGNIKTNAILNLITKFLSSISDNLDPKIEAHRSLFEGFAYVVLERLGSCLYALTFGHQRGETMEVEIAIASKGDEIEDRDELEEEELMLKGAKLEAPYLVRLLDCVMSVAPAHLGALTSVKSGKVKASNSNNIGSMKGALAIGAKERLQRTLVNCMFGTEGMEKNNPLLNCLKMPSINDTALPMPKIKEAEVSDWFREEIWKALGWEILSKEGDW